MKIAVDIDDTLYNFGYLAKEVLTEFAIKNDDRELLQAAYAPWVEWRSPSDIIPDGLWLDVIAECHKPEVILSQQVYRGARTTLKALYNEGYELMYISNRDPDTHTATFRWLMENDLPATELVCTTDSKDKYLDDCKYLIDDRPKTLIEFVYDPAELRSEGREGFGLHTEYNRSLTDVPGITLAPTWAGIDYF